MYLLRQLLAVLAAASTTTSVVAAAAAVPSPQQQQLQPPQQQQQQQPQQQPSLPRSKSTKYFYEAGYTLELGHYDARYFRAPVPYDEHRAALRHLIRSYLSAMRALRVETWLAHGTLLGWWWNGRALPWDYDLDVQVTAATLHYLAKHYNMTLHAYTYSDDEDDGNASFSSSSSSLGHDNSTIAANATTTTTTTQQQQQQQQQQPKLNNTKQYLLDINPHYAEATRGAGGLNVIDARWIDTSNGMFIDITGLLEQRFPGKGRGVWSCKNAHHYQTTQLWPLRRGAFEGVPADIPYAFDPILRAEYGARSLAATVWQGHRWLPARKEWVKIAVLQEGDAVLQ